MARWKKILLSVVGLLLVLIAVGYWLAERYVDETSRKVVQGMANRAQRYGVVLDGVNLANAEVAFPRSVRWQGLIAEATFPNHQAFERQRDFQITVSQVTGTLLGLSSLRVRARGLEIESVVRQENEPDASKARDQAEASRETVEADTLELTIPFDPLDAVESVAESLPSIVSIAMEGETDLPATFEGKLGFVLKGKPVSTGFVGERADGLYKLQIKVDDLRALSPMFDEPLTNAEVELIASMPLRTPRLLRIKNDAESTAKQAYEADESTPEDAYRHVLWSFLLTRAFDEQIAEAVTDAHEAGDTGNSKAEREMDYNNNAVGRRYAAEGVRRLELLEKLLSDPGVILSAD